VEEVKNFNVELPWNRQKNLTGNSFLYGLFIEPFTWNGIQFSVSTLSLQPVRQFLESLMCLKVEAGHERLSLQDGFC
jgi:hypothetical protein